MMKQNNQICNSRFSNKSRRGRRRRDEQAKEIHRHCNQQQFSRFFSITNPPPEIRVKVEEAFVKEVFDQQ